MSNYMDLVREFHASERPVSAVSAVSPLPAVHDTDDPWAKPTAPCLACGQVQWRVWCHDERTVWQWLCNRCRPLVVHNPDGAFRPAEARKE